MIACGTDIHCTYLLTYLLWCVCFLELNEDFDEMLKRNNDLVKQAISNLNAQTSQRPMDTN